MKYFTEKHAVTTDGRIWSKHYKKFLKSHTTTKGYARVTIEFEGKRRNVRVHRIVAEAYIPNPLKLPHINHKNGIKLDNRLKNLEWCTPQHNMQHAIDTGLFVPKGELSELKRQMIRALLREGIHVTKIAKALGLKRDAVRNYVEGKSYKWDTSPLEDNRKNRQNKP